MKPELKPQTRETISKLLLLIGVCFLFAAGFITGGAFQLSRNDLNLTKFWQTYQLIKNNYHGQIDPDRLIEGATRGLVESLDDPFSAYLSKEEKDKFDDELNGEFEGIGAELTLKDGLVTVVAPLADSPAEKSGLKAKDIIIEIDGTATEGMTLNEAVSKIRGPKDTAVTLTVSRENIKETLKLTIKRETIKVRSVNWSMRDRIGYIEISQFGSDTSELAKDAVENIIKRKAKAVILDLRNNPGGYLNSVPPVAGLFLPPSTIVIEKRQNHENKIRSTRTPIAPELPLFVIVNNGSASASEILAGALQDYSRAKIVGSQTFGKGSVQDLINLPDGSALRITIAEWLTPNKRAINGKGIKPDIVIEGDKTLESDPVLDKTLELARQLN